MRNKRKSILYIIIILIVIPIIVGVVNTNKKLPQHISVESPVYYVNDVGFRYDITFMRDGERISEQALMHEALEIIDEAQELLVVDMFLFNDDYDRAKGSYSTVAATLTEAIVNKRTANPQMQITIITDAINTLYGSTTSFYFDQLRQANVNVVVTNVKPLRDSNPIYSSIYRSYLQWVKPTQDGFLPNAFNPDGNKGSVGSYLQLLNFKANHRKIVLNEQRALITSANLGHDGSSLHSNIGFVVEGDILQDIYDGERAIAAMSNINLDDVTFSTTATGEIALQYVTEGKIKEAMIQAVNSSNKGDLINIGVFYIAEREFIAALKDAASRGVNVSLILDPNKDAFGLEKNGIPNRQVAAELMNQPNVTVRWYDTNGEQFHSKFLMVTHNDELTVIGGSANFTRRNISDYNLESNVKMVIPNTHPLAEQIQAYFNRLWTNEDGLFTAEYEKYEDNTLWKKFVYRLQEFTGLSTF